jgi:C1A family cysteine protease
MSGRIEAPNRIEEYAVVTPPQPAFQQVEFVSGSTAMGWLRDNPDFRDFHPDSADIRPMLTSIKAAAPPKALPGKIDLRAWCSPIEDQGSLGACTAHAGMGLVEYMERRANGNHIDGSRRFLYKVTRNMLKWTGDTGAWLRTTMGALACFGVPPESFWPYTIAQFDVEPTPFCYAFADDFKALKYYRLDPAGTNPVNLLSQIRTNLAAGVPVMFGFTVYSSYGQASQTGKLPFPAPKESTVGGHAVDAVGYDDAMKIVNNGPNGPTTTGAFLIRNSWGTGWGDNGYGWLPYDYVLKGLAVDWWALMSQNYVDTKQFGI